MKKYLIFLLVVVLAVGGYWYYAPQMTFKKIYTALETGDADLLEESIDFKKLRKDLKDQLKAQMVNKIMNEQKHNAFAAFSAAISAKFADALIDGFVNPNTFIAQYK